MTQENPKNPATTWDGFYKATEAAPPNDNLVRSMEFVLGRELALDIGAGALRDTKYLLSRGFLRVVAIDAEPNTVSYAQALGDQRVEAHTTTIQEFDFPVGQADLANVQNVFPFLRREDFKTGICRVIDALKPGGIFSGSFFGTRDEWNVPGTMMTFTEKEEIPGLLEGCDIISIEENERDGTTATGTPKHWHTFRVIARKK